MTETATDWRAREDQRQAALEAERAAFLKKRAELRRKLFGSADDFDWQAPAPTEDMDALLAEHAAQLRNAARQAMTFVLDDDNGVKSNALAASALTRLIQTNIAIAKALGAKDASETTKTVRGGGKSKGAQD